MVPIIIFLFKKKSLHSYLRTSYTRGIFEEKSLVPFRKSLKIGFGELDSEQKQEWLTQLQGVALASDAFFPFRDNLDQASQHGVKYVVQPGGSNRDKQVITAANEYGMTMAFSKIRLFHH